MSYSIAWAHYELAGGSRQVWRWVMICGVLSVGGLLGWQRFAGGPLEAVTATATAPLLIGTGVLWALVTAARCSAAVKTDTTQKMLQSHRLMPEPASSAIAGYLIGPSAGPAAGGAVLAALGFFCHLHAGYDAAAYMIALAMIVACGLALCMLAVWSQLESGVASGWAWMLIWPIFMVRGALLAWAPGLLLLAAPFAGPTAFRLRAVEGIDWAHFAGILLYLALAGLFYSAACRRYVREDEPGMSIGHVLLAGGLFVGSTLLMLISPDLFQSGFFDGGTAEPRYALPLAATGLTLLAVWPMVAAERRLAHWRKRKRLEDPFAAESGTHLSALVVAGMFWLLVVVLLVHEVAWPAAGRVYGATTPWWGQAWPAAMAVAGGWLVLLAGLARLLVRLMRQRLLFWVLVGWLALPVIGGAVVHGQRTLELGMDPVVGAISPAGAMWAAWGDEPIVAWLGAALQLAIAAVVWVLSGRAPDRAAEPAVRSQVAEKANPAERGWMGRLLGG